MQRDLTFESPRAATRRPAPRRGRSSTGTATGGLFLLVAIALVSLNLRPAVVAIGPLAESIRSDTGLDSVAISLLTTLPLLCFGAFAAVGPRLARRVGLERAVLVAVVLLVAGVALRLLPPTTALFLGSLVAGVGIALGNVLLPAVVKRHFAEQTGSVMAIYSVALNAGAALAAGLTVPIRDGLGLGWRGALASWGILALAAVVVWLPVASRERTDATDSERTYRVWHSSLAWAAAGFIGLQSFVFYALTAWVPTLLEDAGMSEGRAGLMLSLMAVIGIFGGLAAPVLAVRLEQQRPLAALVVVSFLIGLLGLLVAPTSLAVVWMVVLGIGQGAGISLALTLFVLRARTTAGAAQLSAMAQTAGYLVAAAGPLLAGALHDISGGWTVSLLLLIVVLVPLMAAGWLFGAARTFEDEADGTRAAGPA